MAEEINDWQTAFDQCVNTPLPLAAGTFMERADIEQYLPHRAPFLLLDRAVPLDAEKCLIAAEYDLENAAAVMAGHFPGSPAWPATLQVEAVGQAGALLKSMQDGKHVLSLAVTHILGARFMRPIGAEGTVDIRARVFEDGLFFLVVGQCIYNGEICSVASVQGC